MLAIVGAARPPLLAPDVLELEDGQQPSAEVRRGDLGGAEGSVPKGSLPNPLIDFGDPDC